jgi:hypothetical protein
MVLYIPKLELGLFTPRSMVFLVIFMVPAAVWMTLMLPVLRESVLCCRVLKFYIGAACPPLELDALLPD